jgi:hypothetical protein
VTATSPQLIKAVEALARGEAVLISNDDARENQTDLIDVAERHHGPIENEEHAVMRWAESVTALPPSRSRTIRATHRGLDRTAQVKFACDLDGSPHSSAC